MREVIMLTNEGRNRQRYLDIVDKFCLMHDDFMSAVFKDNPKAVQLVLNIILERDDLHVEAKDIHVQHEIKNLQQRSIKLDVLATDKTGKKYNIEIQRDDRGAGVKRARYHSSLIDSTMLKPSESTDALNDTYVIFITENDVLAKGLPIYHVDRVIRETGEVFKDGSHIIYVNGSYVDDSPLGKLMYDFHCTKAKDMNYADLAEKVRYYKESEGGSTSMCKLVEDVALEERKQGKLEGRLEGKIEEKRETAVKMLKDGMTMDLIAKYSGLTLEQVEELAKTI